MHAEQGGAGIVGAHVRVLPVWSTCCSMWQLKSLHMRRWGLLSAG